MELREKTVEILAAVRESSPMVHHITNRVVMNFTANVTLCMGAAPVMAPCIEESPEMVKYAGALLLNIGTLDLPLVESMMAAGRAANEAGIPVIFDPVGAGATALRTRAAEMICRHLKLSIVRGNAGEILSLAGQGGRVRGVDSMDTLGNRIDVISSLASDRGWTVALTGAEDVVTDGERTVVLTNGDPVMGRVTGTGCAATTAVACCAAAWIDPFEAAAAGIAAMGLAGEKAASLCSGPGTFVPHFLDALANMEPSAVREGMAFHGPE